MTEGGGRSLKDRLRDLGALGGGMPAPRAPLPELTRTAYVEPEAPPEPGIEAYLPGFWQDTPSGRVFVVERRLELDHLHGAIPLRRALSLNGATVARIGREAGLSDIPPERVLYLDTETTGLSGGTGTYAFLVGIGHFCDGGFRLRQYFQTDYGQEGAILRALADYLEGFDALVTFNGKTFDLPLLETRLTINGLHRRIEAGRGVRELPHLDLLHPARRVYRDRFASCRLGELERQVLGLERHEDVPGSEIPALYFRYVRTRRFRAVLPIFEHNALDVLSLVTLATHLCDLFDGGARSAEDRFSIARACETDGLNEAAIAGYRAALEIGLPPSTRQQCEQRLSLLLRRLRRYDEAVALWEAVAARRANRQLYPYLELAKYHERVSRDFAAARTAAEAGLALLERHHLRYGAANASDREALLTRIARIEQRAAKSAAEPPRRVRATKAAASRGRGSAPPMAAEAELHGALA